MELLVGLGVAIFAAVSLGITAAIHRLHRRTEALERAFAGEHLAWREVESIFERVGLDLYPERRSSTARERATRRWWGAPIAALVGSGLIAKLSSALNQRPIWVCSTVGLVALGAVTAVLLLGTGSDGREPVAELPWRPGQPTYAPPTATLLPTPTPTREPGGRQDASQSTLGTHPPSPVQPSRQPTGQPGGTPTPTDPPTGSPSPTPTRTPSPTPPPPTPTPTPPPTPTPTPVPRDCAVDTEVELLGVEVDVELLCRDR